MAAGSSGAESAANFAAIFSTLDLYLFGDRGVLGGVGGWELVGDEARRYSRSSLAFVDKDSRIFPGIRQEVEIS